MSTSIRVKVTVDTDELREWAGRHADAGHHGVAHVLYQAANDGESLTGQAIREAKADAWDEGHAAGYENRRSEGMFVRFVAENPYRQETDHREGGGSDG